MSQQDIQNISESADTIKEANPTNQNPTIRFIDDESFGEHFSLMAKVLILVGTFTIAWIAGGAMYESYVESSITSTK